MRGADYGAQWFKWDLHVHTPATLINNQYGGNTDEAWEHFIKDLEALPPDFKVIGINDYIFIDGYERLLAEKAQGRLNNIELLLPVIELRLKMFGGTQGKLSRLNYHVIFSPALTPLQIRSQFINALCTEYTLSPECGRIEWSESPTAESITELGAKIKQSVPPEQLSKYGSDFVEGFNNLNFSPEHIVKILSKSTFENKYFTAIGKTEYHDIKWTDQSIAEKKSLLNKADFVFTAAPDINSFNKSKESLIKDNLNSSILDCSDAHYLSSSLEKDRIGNCMTWIKADLTFEGLRQIIFEPERVFVGIRPSVLERVYNNKTKYIKSISINKIATPNGNTLKESWFDGISVPLNPELVAIIGNKGNGKSALLDILALLGDSKRGSFSFLNSSRFKNGFNRAQYFDASIKWWDDNVSKKNLNEQVDKTATERVQYLPQDYFETVCNSLDNSFEKEIKSVVFAHLPVELRGVAKNLDELIKIKCEPNEIVINKEKENLSELNSIIVDLERKRSKSYLAELKNRLVVKISEQKAHLAVLPEEEKDPRIQLEENTGGKANPIENEIDQLNIKIREIKTEIDNAAKKYADTSFDLSELDKQIAIINQTENEIKNVKSTLSQVFQKHGITQNDFLDLVIKRDVFDLVRRTFESELRTISTMLDPNNSQSIRNNLAQLENEVANKSESLSAPQKIYQQYLANKLVWDEKLKNINEGLDGDSIKSLSTEIKFVEEILPQLLIDRKKTRDTLLLKIYEEKKKSLNTYKEMYAPVNMQLVDSEVNSTLGSVNIDATLVCEKLEESFFDHVMRNSGGFYGAEEGADKLREMIKATNFDDSNSLLQLIKSILIELKTKDSSDDSDVGQKLLKRNVGKNNFYDWIYSLDYLEPLFEVKLHGKSIEQLSPGEKGALLIIFYLSLDKSDLPILIDQPEENLDNQSVSSILVPFVKAAKKRRQIIIVTHNPNLAVVCDAEQIIYVKIDKANQYKVEIKTGAIENSQINSKIVDVLEGTMPAFTLRNDKYGVTKKFDLIHSTN